MVKLSLLVHSGLALGALGLSLAASACSVNRRTEDFACAIDADCAPGRRCDPSIGYCVAGTIGIPDANTGCPTACNNGCDTIAKTCIISCTGTTNCTDVTCPSGYDCTINCATNSCDNIRCFGDSECTINCIGANACGNVDCGDGDCSVICNGSNACDNVDCNDARCEIACTGANACAEVDCDSACRCDVQCLLGSTCDTKICSAPACDSPTGCTSTQTNCPNTCP